MFAQPITRRRFLQASAATAGTLAVGYPAGGADDPGSLRIVEPVHGAVLNRHHGRAVDGGLKIRVVGAAPADRPVRVEAIGEGRGGSVAAVRNGAEFEAEIVLRDRETDIVATVGDTAGPREAIRVVWDRNSRPRYRFAVDDNSFFLRDIWQKQYDSLFDCFYLAMYRDLHKKYGAKFVLNIYWTTADEFDLTKFPDRYRGEWRDNADWLKLAFHAHANDPPRPYFDAPPEQVIADFEKIREQINRFAGEATYSPTTIVHWGVVRPSAWKPLAEHGVKVLSGYFQKQRDEWVVNYRMDPTRSEYLSRHDALKDFPSGIVFSNIDMVCNTVPLDRIVPQLDEIARDPNQAEIIDLMTHEQYFWPFYSNYLPDHRQRIETAIRWATEHGYEPVFLHEGFLGLPV
ncbi:MAG: twin-arginine translocation signal domain-containing protein [Rhodopirellula sp.]|nr:twin-arginine translocation signal domain-containing protein [Rhodopirellula sp.]